MSCSKNNVYNSNLILLLKNNNESIENKISKSIEIPKTKTNTKKKYETNFQNNINNENKCCLNINDNYDIYNKNNNINLVYNNSNLYNVNYNSFFPSDNNMSPNNNIQYLDSLDLKSKVSSSSYENFYMNKY